MAVKPRFESALSRIADSSQIRKGYRGITELPLLAWSISFTAVATSHPLQPRLESTPKITTTSSAVRGGLSISVSNAVRDEPSTSPNAGLEARRSKGLQTRASILLRAKATTHISYPLLRGLTLQYLLS
jgi:hypothetical protein